MLIYSRFQENKEKWQYSVHIHLLIRFREGSVILGFKQFTHMLTMLLAKYIVLYTLSKYQLIKMEIEGTKATCQGSILVFIGYLLSSSLMVYFPHEQTGLNSLSVGIRVLPLSIILVSYLIGFIIYFKTSCCSFLLEICQYLFVPISTFFVVNKINFIKNSSNVNLVQELIQLFIVFLIIMFTVIKILFINQSFPGQKSKQILTFSILNRIFKLVKIICNCIGFWILGTNEAMIVFSVSNVVDFFVSAYQINFMQVQIQSAAMLASFNNLISVCVYWFVGNEFISLGLYLPEIFLFIIFLMPNNPSLFLLTFKYTRILKKLENSNCDFENKECKGSVMVFLSCLNYMINFNEHHKIVNESNVKNWPNQFLTKIKSIYTFLLYLYLYEITQNNFGCNSNQQINQSSCHMTQTAIISKASNKRKQIQGDMQSKLVQKYKQIYNKQCTVMEIIQDDLLLVNFISFCIDRFQQMKDSNLKWTYSDQFLLNFTCQITPKFYMKQLQISQKRQNKAQQNILSKARNQQFKTALAFYKTHYKFQQTESQKYMKFEFSINKLKKQISKCCNDESQLLQKLSNPIKNIFQIEDHIERRSKNKDKTIKLFEQSFKDQYYQNSQQFTYLFLLFMIVFCKSIHQTSGIIKNKFKIPKIVNKVSSLYGNSKFDIISLQIKPLLVCCAVDNNPDYKKGEIIVSNSLLRKKFGICKNSVEYRSKKIGDFIPQKQRFRHNDLMTKSVNFENISVSEQKHSDYKCLIKVNLGKQKVQIMKEYRIQTKVFHSFENVFGYICTFQQASQETYIFESDIKILEAELSTNAKIVNLEEKQIQYFNQLGAQMSMVRITNQELDLFGLSVNIQQKDQESLFVNYGDESLGQQILDEKQEKYSKMQRNIWKRQISKQANTLNYTIISIISFILGCLTCLITIDILYTNLKMTSRYNQEYSEIMQKSQDCPLKISFYTYLLRKIAIKEINTFSCFPFEMDLKRMLENGITKCFKQQIPDIFKEHIQDQMETAPFFTPDFMNYSVPLLTSSKLDYSNYIMRVSAYGNFYVNQNLSGLNAVDEMYIMTFIRGYSRVGKNSFAMNFTNLVSEANTQLLIRVQSSSRRTLILGMLISIIMYTISIICVVKIYMYLLEYIKLLTGLQQYYYRQRIYEINYMMKQMNRLSDYNFITCQFYNNYEVNIKNQNYEGSDSYDVSFECFQKIAEQDFVEKQGIVQQEVYINHEKVSALLTVLINKKWYILTILFFNVICISMLLGCGNQYNSAISNSFLLNRIVKQGGITKQYLLALNFENWQLFFNDTKVNPLSTTYQRIRQYHSHLNEQKFYFELFENLDLDILQKTGYLTMCQALDLNKAMELKLCETILGQFYNIRVSEYVSLVLSGEYKEYKAFKQYDQKPSIWNVCLNMFGDINFVIPSMLNQWKTLLKIINDRKIEYGYFYEIVFYFSGFLGIVVICFILFRNYMKLVKKVKFEVLTFDTTKDLYQYQSFRPSLNRMYQQCQF